MSIADERYIRLATRTTDGRPRHVPVWIVGLGGSRVGFTTGSGSWKVHRLSHDPAVDGDAYREVCAAIRRKYGIQHVGAWLASAVGRHRGRNPSGDRDVIITLD
jgi:hypothetical protein